MAMHTPTHPGEIIADELRHLGLGISEAAERLGIGRVTLSRVTNAHAAITPNLANRLELAGVGTARMWLALQNTYDLAGIRATKAPEVRSLASA